MIHSRKSHLSRARFGFTLIELLIVIVIIAILASLSFQIGSYMLTRARKVVAGNTASQLGQAIIAYDMHYNRYPIDSASSGSSGDVGPLDSDGNLMSHLIGRSDLNPDAEVFYGGKRVEDMDKPKGGLAIEGVSNPPALLDPWVQPGASQGMTYRVWIDADLDGKLKDPLTSRTLRLPVLVMSAGPDGKWGSGDDGDAKDNVKSW